MNWTTTAWAIQFSDGSFYFENDCHPERVWRTTEYRAAASIIANKSLEGSARIVPAPAIDVESMRITEAWQWLQEHPEFCLQWDPSGYWVVHRLRGPDPSGSGTTRLAAIRSAAKKLGHS